MAMAVLLVTTSMLSSPKKATAVNTLVLKARSAPPTIREEEERFKQECLHDVELLLQDLFRREEATVKLILSYLYDIGAINIINKKIPFAPLNSLLKSLVGVPKPLAKRLIIRWFHRQCPGIVSRWLFNKVKF
jgi:hypothetical protein